eukprot:TRINITY_DN4647_c0_g1_i1.p1 TRINITY_DN4647_c0_g1~~TRINITY_DN4647_c0_g1_i1.p1  ORF type:complete len:372 (+),score=124.80 TRINITY_DN4647_c0_g1_i1:46-1161(+)
MDLELESNLLKIKKINNLAELLNEIITKSEKETSNILNDTILFDVNFDSLNIQHKEDVVRETLTHNFGEYIFKNLLESIEELLTEIQQKENLSREDVCDNLTANLAMIKINCLDSKSNQNKSLKYYCKDEFEGIIEYNGLFEFGENGCFSRDYILNILRDSYYSKENNYSVPVDIKPNLIPQESLLFNSQGEEDDDNLNHIEVEEDEEISYYSSVGDSDSVKNLASPLNDSNNSVFSDENEPLPDIPFDYITEDEDALPRVPKKDLNQLNLKKHHSLILEGSPLSPENSDNEGESNNQTPVNEMINVDKQEEYNKDNDNRLPSSSKNDNNNNKVNIIDNKNNEKLPLLLDNNKDIILPKPPESGGCTCIIS